MHVGQAAVAAVVAEGELLVVDAEQVQDRGVQVVAVVRLAALSRTTRRSRRGDAALDARAGEPGDESAAVVVAARRPCVNGMRPNSVVQTTSVSSNIPRALRSFSSAATGLSVASAMGGSSLAMLAWLSQLLVGAAGAAPDLHEAHAALEHPPRDQTAAAEILGGFVVEAVELARGLGFAGEVEHFRGAAAASSRPARRRRCAPRAASRPAIARDVSRLSLSSSCKAVGLALRGDELRRLRREQVGDRRRRARL